MRAEIAMALMHDPKILFLDEPTIGLDVVAKDVVRKFLTRINRERGTTIILTTHDLQDIEEICPRLIMVDEGKLLFDGSIADLRVTFGAKRRLTLEFAHDPGHVELADAEPLEGEGAVREFLLPDDNRSLVQLIGALKADSDLRDVRLHEPGIEEIIRTHYQSKCWHECLHRLGSSILPPRDPAPATIGDADHRRACRDPGTHFDLAGGVCRRAAVGGISLENMITYARWVEPFFPAGKPP